MNISQTSWLMQKAVPLIMKEIGPQISGRLGPVIAEKVGIPLAKKVGLPIAKRIGVPIARKTGMVFLKRVGYPLANRILFNNTEIPSKVNLIPTTDSEKGKDAKDKRKKNNLFKTILKKNPSKKKQKSRINKTLLPPVPTNVTPVQPQTMLQSPPQSKPSAFYQYNNNSRLFGRRRQNTDFDFE